MFIVTRQVQCIGMSFFHVQAQRKLTLNNLWKRSLNQRNIENENIENCTCKKKTFQGHKYSVNFYN